MPVARRASIVRWLLIAGALWLALVASGRAAAQPADRILVNGRIITLDQQSTIAEAIAIRGERIAATGTVVEMMRLAEPRTRIVDLGGRTVIPGLIDSHIHAIRAGFRYGSEVSWTGRRSLAEALLSLKTFKRFGRSDAWIVVAGGWTPQQFEEARRPTQSELMAVAGDRPAYVQLFYRAALLTPQAMASLGIGSDADVPPKGHLERDATGNRTGWITGDSATITALYDRLPKPGFDEATLGTEAYFHELNRFGLTGVIDPGGHNLAPADYQALFLLWQQKRLTLRVAYSMFAPRRGHELEDFKQLTTFLPMGLGDDMLRFNGIGENAAWGVYNNDAPTEDDKRTLEEVARWAGANDMTLTLHWNNDRSVHHLLEVLERIGQDVPMARLRWSIAHLHDGSVATLERMKRLGVGWLMQDGLHYASADFIAERGRAAVAHMPPIVSGLKMGLRIGGGTDANRVMDHNPFVSLRWMLDGLTVDGIPTRDAAEIPSREQALRLYTQGSAWFAFAERDRGTLEAGKLADLAVLSADYLTVPLAEIDQIESLLTLVGGKAVYGVGTFSGASR